MWNVSLKHCARILQACLNIRIKQVMTPGGHWFKAAPVANTVLVMMSDLMPRWTANRINATVFTFVCFSQRILHQHFCKLTTDAASYGRICSHFGDIQRQRMA